MNTKQLRQKVLDLAIHGKLVPQCPDDEPASVLLNRIQDEKAALVKAGKLKKKDLETTPIADDEKLFDIPESWEWTNIGELLVNRDAERIPLSLGVRSKQQNKVYNYYGATGVVDKVDGFLFEERLLLIGEDGANLLSRSKDNAFFADGKYWVNNHAHVLDCPFKSILNYAAMIINSISLEDYVTGSAQPKLNQENLNKITVPLPPLSEQQRIVAAVEQWMSLIDVIESGKKNLQQSIALAKNKILDLAIRGKLVPQEGEWEEKTGKEVFEPLISTKPSGEYFNYIDIDSIDNKKCRVIEPKKVLVANAPSRASRHTQRGDVLFSMVRPYLRNIALVEEDNCIASTGFYVCRTKLMTPKFCYYLMISEYVVQGLNFFMKGDNSPSITNKNILDFKFPLPPLSEQHRIVAKIEELFAQLDEIEKSLN